MNDDLIDRVRKLLAMAADASSPHEASIAAGRARKLMDTHQISLADLKQSDGFGFRYAGKSYRFMPIYHRWLALAVGRLNDCKVTLAHEYKTINRSYSYRNMFQGFESDCQCAEVMYDFLLAQIDKLCGEYIIAYIRPRGITRYPAKIGDSFKKGAAEEVVNRLTEMLEERKRDLKLASQPGTSLVIYKMAQVEEKFGKQTVKNSTVKLHGGDANHARQVGQQKGRTMELQPKVRND